MPNGTITPAEALREAAEEREHDAEYNQTVTMRWSPARQRANTKLILEARELRDRADALDAADGTAPNLFICKRSDVSFSIADAEEADSALLGDEGREAQAEYDQRWYR